MTATPTPSGRVPAGPETGTAAIRTVGSDQAVRLGHRGRRGSTSTSAPGDIYGFLGAERLRQDHDCPDAARAGVRDRGRGRGARRPVPKRGARGAAAGSGALVEAPAAYGAPVRPGQPGPVRRGRAGRPAADPARRDRRGAGAGGPGRRRSPAGQGVLAGHAAAARPGRGAAAHAATCWSWTSPPTGWTRAASTRSATCCSTSTRGRHDGLPVQPPAGRGRAAVHPGRRDRPRPAGAAGRAGRPAAADRADRCCARPTPERAVGAARRRGSERSGDAARGPRLRPGRAQRAAGRAGIRITELTEERRTLEEVVLAATTGSSDRVDGAVRQRRVLGPRSSPATTRPGTDRRPGRPCPCPPAHPATPSPGRPVATPRSRDPAGSRPGRSRSVRRRTIPLWTQWVGGGSGGVGST